MDFTIKTVQTDASVSIETICENEAVSLYRIGIRFPKACLPSPVTVSWSEPMREIYSTWHPCAKRDRAVPQWFRKTVSASRFCKGAPVLCTLRQDGTNVLTAALSDCSTPVSLTFCVDDFHEKDEDILEAVFFTEPSDPVVGYEAVLRLDRRCVPFYQAIRETALWWETGHESKKDIPLAAEMPLYSSWYNFHQNPRQELLTSELKLAAECGFKTVIIDDGWQFEGTGSGTYIDCGDWVPAKDKFSDTRKFVDDVHSFGMKVMYWFCVPFVGYHTEAFRRFEDRLLFKYDYSGDAPFFAGVLDVRYKDIRDYIVNLYTDFVRRYDLDGLKLDFIDSFRAMPETPLRNDNMDCDSVDQAVKRLLDEITAAMNEIKDDFLMEFRQAYVGPDILRYGNMVRVGDCAFDSVTNRNGVIDLRMLCPGTAVHSDMLLWSPEEPITGCAAQLLDILFSVPQISVLFTRSTGEQKLLLRRYLDYWKTNRELLLHGNFSACHPEACYSMAASEDSCRRIAVLYSESAYTYTGKSEDVFNNTGCDSFLLRNDGRRSLQITVYDCLGEKLTVLEVNGSAALLPVPAAGHAEIRPL